MLKKFPKAVSKVPKAVVKAYLKRYPQKLRLSRFNKLKKYSWMKSMWVEIRDELFPEEIPTTEEESSSIVVAKPVLLPPAAGVQLFNSPYGRYSCTQGNPLNCDGSVITEEDFESACSVCGFPKLLPVKSLIKGQLGTYRIEQHIGRRGIGFQYAATQLGVNQPVVIKEYLLPERYFNPEEIRQKKQGFKSLAGFSLADGRIQDLRCLQPLEAIVDEIQPRCYLIMDERGGSPTLNRYLSLGLFSPLQVRAILQMVLQSLEFLHGQKFRLPSGKIIDGLAHGNLSLDSLLLIGNWEPGADIESTDFFVYLCDLAIWEQLFQPLSVESRIHNQSQDLVTLGYIAFYLLAGNVTTDSGQALDPKIENHWNCGDLDLKHFILRLMELEVPFENAEIARQELLRLPKVEFISSKFLPEEVKLLPPAKKKYSRLLILLMSVLGLGVIGGIAWLLFAKPQSSVAENNTPVPCCLNKIKAIPNGEFTYTASAKGIWEYVSLEEDLIRKDETLEERIQTAQPKLNLNYQPSESRAEAISKVDSGEADFAIVPLIEPLPNSLKSEIIAYDGLVPIVAFSYSQRQKGLPNKLKGKITLNQLEQLYSGNINYWDEIKGPTIPVELYAPQDKEAREIFTSRILTNQQTRNSGNVMNAQVRLLSEIPMMRAVIKDFEDRQKGGIGFSSISKIVGQCSVYPLALQNKRKSPLQPLIMDNGKPINPSIDLCDRKGSYHPNVELFKTGKYPLAYPIAVVYPRDNDRSPIGEKFAQILRTREGQRLLGKTGLVTGE